jgi:TP53 regulating kinase-like protein
MASGGIPMWKPENLLHEGAEATVIGGSWLGKRAVLKSRRARGYRHPDLDRRLTRQRLAAEARILSRLSSVGFPSPKLMFLDQRKSSMLLSRIEGRTLHDLLKSDDASGDELFSLGGLIRRLHEIGISHGDLTTHNVMATTSGALHLIDFGLSRLSPELEHMGLDLQVLRECLGASHSTIPNAIDKACEGYLDAEVPNNGSETAENVMDRFRKIAGRVRYHG